MTREPPPAPARLDRGPETDPNLARLQRQALELRAAAPLRGRKAAVDVTGLALFEPQLI